MTKVKSSRVFPKLDDETRTHVDTETAAYHLNRKVQTLRIWSAYDSGPLKPVRAGGRLLWPVAAIRHLTFGSTKGGVPNDVVDSLSTRTRLEKQIAALLVSRRATHLKEAVGLLFDYIDASRSK